MIQVCAHSQPPPQNTFSNSLKRNRGNEEHTSGNDSEERNATKAVDVGEGEHVRRNTSVQKYQLKQQSMTDLHDKEENNVVKEFVDILSAEDAIDLGKLRDAARHGIPSEVRRDVWTYLLGVQPADRSKEMSIMKAKTEEYNQIDKENPDIIKRLRGEATRYMRRSDAFKNNNINVSMFENVISAYINHNKTADYYPALVHICGPFVAALQKESEIYYCFEKLMSQLDDYYTHHSISERVATFVRLFRSVLPDLYNYFEDEEVDVNEWATSWLQHLLATALPLDNLLRLWDAYFSLPDGLDLHLYVCLAVLKHSRESLEELEQSEIRTLLLRLPKLDMDQVLNLAFNIRWDSYESEM